MFKITHKRDLIDSIEDTILLLYLLHESNGKIVGENDYLDAQIKVMKLIFLSELETHLNNEKGFNFFYNTYKKGPCSKEVFAILDDLADVDLITSDYKKNSINITEKGEKVISNFLKNQKPKIKSHNQSILQKIDKVLKEYGKLTTKELIEKIYAMNIKTPSGKKINIGKAVKDFERTQGKCKPLLLIKSSDYKKKLNITPEWIETFSVLCNPRFKDVTDLCYV